MDSWEVPSPALSQSLTAVTDSVSVAATSGGDDGVEGYGDLIELNPDDMYDSDEEDGRNQQSQLHSEKEQQQSITATATAATNKRRRGNYRCRRCGQPKKGHVCPYEDMDVFEGEDPLVHEVGAQAIGTVSSSSPVKRAASSVLPHLHMVDKVSRQALHLGKVLPPPLSVHGTGNGVILTPQHLHDRGTPSAAGRSRLHMGRLVPFSLFPSRGTVACEMSHSTKPVRKNLSSTCPRSRSASAPIGPKLDRRNSDGSMTGRATFCEEDPAEFDVPNNACTEDEHNGMHVAQWQGRAFAGGPHQTRRMTGPFFVGRGGASLRTVCRGSYERDERVLLAGGGVDREPYRNRKRKILEVNEDDDEDEDEDDGAGWSDEATLAPSYAYQPFIVHGPPRAKKKVVRRRHPSSVVSSPSGEADGLAGALADELEAPFGSPVLSTRGEMSAPSVGNSSLSGSEVPSSSRPGVAPRSALGSACNPDERQSQDVCMLHILSKLAPQDLLAASACCRRWRRLAAEIWSNVEEMCFLLGDRKPPLIYVPFMLRKCPHLIRTTLKVLKPIDDELLQKISELRPSFQSLVIQVAPDVECQVTGSGISSFLSSCQSLQKLEVERCSLLTSLAATSSSLRSLSLSSCSELASLQLDCPCLEELCLDLLRPDSPRSVRRASSAMLLSSSDQEGEETRVHNLISHISSHRQSLVSLRISSSALTDPLLKELFSAQWNCLQTLSFTFAPSITDASVKHIAKQCRHLTSIDLSGCRSLTDMALFHLSSGAVPTLQRVQVAGCPQISTVAIEKLVACLPELQLLDCSGSLVIRSRVSEAQESQDTESTTQRRMLQGPTSPGSHAGKEDSIGSAETRESAVEKENSIENWLRSANGSSEGGVGGQHTESGVLRLQHPKVVHVSLWGCTAIQGIEVDCPQLEDLNMNSCCNLSPARIFLHCPQLQRLHVARCLPDVVRHLRQQQDFFRRRLDVR
ncbi:hypothetical protein CBR_g29330 [Chara braunii]|uniref:F-box domain-containing protein n=1 Tax=Chara braunii TaxID=69332 RepID=A0A388JWG6_CHABU|nr:hypothetical protein CBR_g29330 [Chara braunii]|eukprot:GBG62130.1 hypothetical protein CBR_g29330 [Chara braunii]